MATARSVREIIEGALRRCGVFKVEDGAPVAHMQVAMTALQDILAEWSSAGWEVPVVVQETFNLAVGTASYTVGQNGSPSLNSARPVQVMGAFVRDSGNNDYPVEIIGVRERRLITPKNLTGRPTSCYVLYGSPNVTFYMEPVPNAVEAFYFDSKKNLGEPTGFFDSMLDTVQIPRNYHTALMWNLAKEVAEIFGQQPTIMVMSRAKETKANIMSLNAARNVEPVRLDIMPTQRTYNTSDDWI